MKKLLSGRRRPIAAVAVIAALALVGIWLARRSAEGRTPAYRFATVERGDVTATVSATGTLSALTTVQVGTQVSGQVAAIYADFNDHVRKGQLIARIDPTLQRQTVRDAEAQLERAQAERAEAAREYDRNRELHASKVVTDAELSTAQYKLAVAQAGVKSAQVTLDRARQNLAYTAIYAPVDGIVIERNVDVGQTVAASLSAPQLFLLAKDLSRMQILAAVDESDIGAIKEGEPARFSVQAFPGRTFTGTVRQVRLQSKSEENVVTYTAVVEVANPDRQLLPGMTATVDFVTDTAAGVLTVPNAALRFQPTEEMLAQVHADTLRGGSSGGSGTGTGGSTGFSRGGSSGGFSGGAGFSSGASGRGGSSRGGRGSGRGGAFAGSGRRAGWSGNRPRQIWYLDASGKLAVARVRPGITDGQHTQVTSRALREGMQVIIGLSDNAAEAQATNRSPFQTTPQQSGPPRAPGGF